jgi:hypothetical protein
LGGGSKKYGIVEAIPLEEREFFEEDFLSFLPVVYFLANAWSQTENPQKPPGLEIVDIRAASPWLIAWVWRKKVRDRGGDPVGGEREFFEEDFLFVLSGSLFPPDAAKSTRKGR